MKNTIILMAGAARSGKDTSADILAEKFSKIPDVHVNRTYFAKALKLSLKKVFGLTDRHVFGDKKEKNFRLSLDTEMWVRLTLEELHHGALMSVDSHMKKLGQDTLTTAHNIVAAMVKAIRENGVELGATTKFDRYSVSPRQLMQWWGTEAVRVGAYDGAWIDCVKFDIGMEGAEVSIISDARFDNEVSEIKSAFPDHNVIAIQVIRPGNVQVASHVSEAGISLHLIDNLIENDDTLAVLADTLEQVVQSVLN